MANKLWCENVVIRQGASKRRRDGLQEDKGVTTYCSKKILVWLDGTITDITILVTMYYSGYVGL